MASTMNLMDTMPAASQCARGVRCAQSGSACHTRCLHLSRASCLCLDVLMCLSQNKLKESTSHTYIITHAAL